MVYLSVSISAKMLSRARASASSESLWKSGSELTVVLNAMLVERGDFSPVTGGGSFVLNGDSHTESSTR